MPRRRGVSRIHPAAVAAAFLIAVMTVCLCVVIFVIGRTASGGASAIKDVVKAFAGQSKNSFTVYISSVSGDYALKVATTHGTLRADREFARLWAYSKVAVTVPYEAAWTLSLDRSLWSAERRGNALVVHCPAPVADKPYLDMTKLEWKKPEASSLIISETAMWEEAQKALLAEAPTLVAKQERNLMAVQDKAKAAVERLTREWLAQEFPGAKDVPIEVEFGKAAKAEASTK